MPKKQKWSKYQETIFKEVENLRQHLIIEAGAGCGKSTTLFKAVEYIPEDKKILFLAFNKSIEKHATKQLKGLDVECQTFHGHGLSILKQNIGKFEIDKSKVHYHLERYSKNNKIHKSMFFSMLSLITTIRQHGILSRDPEVILKLIKENEAHFFKWGAPSYLEALVNRSVTLLKILDVDFSRIDFDDMCTMPILHGMIYKLKKKDMPDILLVDEVQDLNSTQLETIRQYLLRKPTLKVISVGDRKQAIYGFRGALDSMSKLETLLNPKILPLPLTYRTHSEIVDFVNASCLDSKLEAFHKGGKVIEVEGIEINPYLINSIVYNNIDMIVSPKNKHILRLYLILTDMHVAATIKGSKLIPELKKSVNSLAYLSFPEFISTLENMAKPSMFANKNKDKAETLLALVNWFGFNSITSVKSKLDELEKKDKGKGIVMHTGHSSKGLEGDRVAVINDFFDMQGQEDNLKYVAYTRCKELLLIITPADTDRFKRKVK